jgi:putative Mn2+ efflux pump MntP
MSAFVTYLIGFMLIAVGLAIAAYLLNVPPMWIGAGLLVVVGLGVVRASSRTRPRDPPR